MLFVLLLSFVLFVLVVLHVFVLRKFLLLLTLYVFINVIRVASVFVACIRRVA